MDNAMRKAASADDLALTPELGEFRSVIEWLMRVGEGVSSSRLAALFGTSAENIRRLKFYASRRMDPSLITFIPDLDLIPSTAMHRGAGIRSHKEILRRSEKPSATLDWLAERVETQFNTYRGRYQFLAGARSLGLLKQRLGHMSEARRIALAGILEQKIAWFFVHSGYARSAVDHATRSLWLLQTAYYRLGRKDDVREYLKTALIASQANLLAGRPEAALQILDIRRDAAVSIDAPLGSDHFRQRGVSLFQLGRSHDDEALTSFAESAEHMRRLCEGNETQVLMTGTRHTSLLGKPDWQGSLRVLEETDKTFAPNSLEVAMARHWAAACGLLTDARANRQRAQELLEENRVAAARFGHQATIAKLLAMTPELRLSRGLQAVWVRKALYQNTFRIK